MKENNKYNTKEVQAISAEYRKARQERNETKEKIKEINKTLTEKKDSLSIQEYSNLIKQREWLIQRHSRIGIEIEIWDKAREICLNVATEEKR